MRTISTEKRLCECCMQEHEVKTVVVKDSNLFKGRPVSYDAVSFYCDNAGEFFENEEMVNNNDIAMKNAYRKASGLLTAEDIVAIRNKYSISQNDFSAILGWGAKTITRYESHQVQDNAHDAILRKIDKDPEWFLYLLESSKEELSEKAYYKYYKAGMELYNSEKDSYLKKVILSKYANISDKDEYTGRASMDFGVIVDAINYFARSKKVLSLYKVKLMKLLWYADALSFKLRDRSMTGMAYQCLPMGAVPLAHDLLIELDGIVYEEIEIGDGTAYKFVYNNYCKFDNLNDDDIDILNRVIDEFGSFSKDGIVDSMHSEVAYLKTEPNELISYEYAKDLSI